MLDPFVDDSSSTNEEIQRLWDKLDTLQSSGKLERDQGECHYEISTPPPLSGNGQISTMIVTAESKHVHAKLINEGQVTMPNMPPFHQSPTSSSSSSSSSPLPLILTKRERKIKKETIDEQDNNKKEELTGPEVHAAAPPALPPLSPTRKKKLAPKINKGHFSKESGSSISTSSSSSSSDTSSTSSSSSAANIGLAIKMEAKCGPPRTVEVRSSAAIHSPLSSTQFASDAAQSPPPSTKLRFSKKGANVPIQNPYASPPFDKARIKVERSNAKKSRQQEETISIQKGDRARIKNPYATRSKHKETDNASRNVKKVSPTYTTTQKGGKPSPFFEKNAPKSEPWQKTANKKNKHRSKNDPKAKSIATQSSPFSSCNTLLLSPSISLNPSDSDGPNVEAKDAKKSIGDAPRDPLDDVAFQDYQPEPEPTPEIDPSLLSPPRYKEKPRPILHQFSIHNRPINGRTKIAVANLFPSTLNLLWRSKFNEFNHLQSEVANLICHSDDNIVVSAPTGAGKTAIFEMGLARFIGRDLQFHGPFTNGPPQMSRERKVVYFAPSKALCEERYEDWSRRLSQLHLGIEVVMITGDAKQGHSYNDLARAHLILTTPEKWDSLLRRWTEIFFLIASVKLLLLDEVHQLGDPSRGSCLEAIITRMKHIHNVSQKVQISKVDLCSTRYVQQSFAPSLSNFQFKNSQRIHLFPFFNVATRTQVQRPFQRV